MEKITEEVKNLILQYINLKNEQEILFQQIKKRTQKHTDEINKLISEIRKEHKAEREMQTSEKRKEIALRKKNLDKEEKFLRNNM